jgi:hypothetical protein
MDNQQETKNIILNKINKYMKFKKTKNKTEILFNLITPFLFLFFKRVDLIKREIYILFYFCLVSTICFLKFQLKNIGKNLLVLF